jgi:hypothetical protein
MRFIAGSPDGALAARSYVTRQDDSVIGNAFDSSSVVPRYEHLTQYPRGSLGNFQVAVDDSFALAKSS